ncbi:MAG: hypothetical protein HC902_01940 [Calothrix sp. SM1_5_4]|nr:hypothetical protein [Calothrix sp. SM1_5_4]
MPGRMVIRRLVGPSSGAWRVDTVDAYTGEPLGSQGVKLPYLDSRDLEIMKIWGVGLVRDTP